MSWGDVTLDLADQPITVLRDTAGAFRAMSKICRHRMSVLLEGRGNMCRIVCPSHTWTSNLDGSPRGAPAMDQNDGFCESVDNPPEIRAVTNGWAVSLRC